MIDDLRKRGVLYYKHGDLEITLGALPGPEEEKETESVDNPPKVRKRGKDGLTADEQLEVYDRVIDAEE